jgi:hypothetical protein
MDTQIGRPERDETIEYYFKYIDLVPDGEIPEILENQRDETLSFLKTIPDARAEHRYEAGKWSISEVLAHINDAERLFTMRAFWFARGFESELPSYDSDVAVSAAKPAARSLSSHIHEFGSVRDSTLDFFRYLPSEAWVRRGVASTYAFSVRALAYIAAGHVIHHTQILRDRYLS